MMWTHLDHPFHLRSDKKMIGRMSSLPIFEEPLAGINFKERDREPIGAHSDSSSLNIVKEVLKSGILGIL